MRTPAELVPLIREHVDAAAHSAFVSSSMAASLALLVEFCESVAAALPTAAPATDSNAPPES